jgi:hypothetical protein
MIDFFQNSEEVSEAKVLFHALRARHVGLD